jgi:hypothetical protein
LTLKHRIGFTSSYQFAQTYPEAIQIVVYEEAQAQLRQAQQ